MCISELQSPCSDANPKGHKIMRSMIGDQCKGSRNRGVHSRRPIQGVTKPWGPWSDTNARGHETVGSIVGHQCKGWRNRKVHSRTPMQGVTKPWGPQSDTNARGGETVGSVIGHQFKGSENPRDHFLTGVSTRVPQPFQDNWHISQGSIPPFRLFSTKQTHILKAIHNICPIPKR